MKKVFLAFLCAGLFVACGNKNKNVEPEAVVDSVATEVVEEAPVVEEPVAEAPAQETKAPAKKTNTSAKKSNDGKMTASSSSEAPTVEEHAKQAASKVAHTAINKAESDATNQIQTQKRR